MAGADGWVGENWLLRPDRTASWLRNLRRNVDDCEAGWRHLDHQWSEEMDRQRSVVRHFYYLGSRRSGQPGQSIHRGEQDHAWLQSRKNPKQDRPQSGPERADHDGRLPNTGSEPFATRSVVPRHRPRSEDDALHGWLAADWLRHGRLRECPQILPGTPAFWNPTRPVPDAPS